MGDRILYCQCIFGSVVCAYSLPTSMQRDGRLVQPISVIAPHHVARADLRRTNERCENDIAVVEGALRDSTGDRRLCKCLSATLCYMLGRR